MGAEFQYSVLRVVPSLERGERINVGVVLYCRRRGFLAARVHVDPARMAALAPQLDCEAVAGALTAMVDIAAGVGEGPLAALPPSERFGWLAAPASTMIQPSPTHTGLSDDPQATLDRLFRTLVATPDPGRPSNERSEA
jgi:hypothetical protein